MTNERARTELEQLYMSLSEEKKKALDVAIKALEQQPSDDLPSVKPQEPKWIPVSERLPKNSDIVLLSLPPHIDPDGEECSASVICGHYIGGWNADWGLSDGDTFGYGIVSVRKGTNPIAWMPLPKPFKPQESEKPYKDWYDVPSDKMTLEQARQAVKDLRKKLAEYL